MLEHGDANAVRVLVREWSRHPALAPAWSLPAATQKPGTPG